MTFVSEHLLSTLVFLPLIGALIALAFPTGAYTGVRGFALAVTLADFALALVAWLHMDPSQTHLQLMQVADWVPAWGMSYSIGVDGISMLLVLLTTFMAPIVILSTYASIQERTREYMVCLLLLQTCILGSFVACDLILFYTFWECMLIPTFFMIGLWGGRQRTQAAMTFFLYTMAGSLLMLVAIIYTAWAVRDGAGWTFFWPEVAQRLSHRELGWVETWLFLAFVVAFGIKVPLLPVHTWLPLTYREAPTSTTVLLSGVMAKVGAFAFFRYALGLFPHTAVAFLPLLGALAVLGILYGALVAWVQKDAKQVIAFSSLSHMGFIMLGLLAMTEISVSGGFVQMLSHAISTGALFLLIGILDERRHSRAFEDLGGLAQTMPVYASIFVLMVLSSMGLPGLAGFVGEFLILVGAFCSQGLATSWSTAEMAQLGIGAIWFLALLAVGIFFANVLRHNDQLTRFSKAFLFGLMGLGIVVLVAPQMGDLPGGLLLQPLLAFREDALPFHEVYPLLAIVATLGLVLSAVYLLYCVQRILFGPQRQSEASWDLSARECLMFLPLIALSLAIGLHPQPFLDLVTPSATYYTEQFRERAGIPTQGSDEPAPVSTPNASLRRVRPKRVLRPHRHMQAVVPQAPGIEPKDLLLHADREGAL